MWGTAIDPTLALRSEFESYPEDASAWIQVAAGSALFAVSVGGIYTWGVFQDALVLLGVGNSRTVAWIGSTQATLQAFFAIVVGRLIAHYGAVSSRRFFSCEEP